MARVQPTWPAGSPGPCRIAIVGDCPTDGDVFAGRPFAGEMGRELDAQLATAGIDRAECLLTNVIADQPPGNSLAAFCIRKEDLPSGYPLHIGPMVKNSGDLYLHPDRLAEGARLRSELEAARPNVVVALGPTACWALLGSTSLSGLRGSVHRSITRTPFKVVPTWHPSLVLRQWKERPVAIADLVKAQRESAYPDIRYDNAELWLRPTLDDLYEFERRYMRGPHANSVDVETARGEITCVGFAPTDRHAIVVPFRTDPVQLKLNGVLTWVMTGNYWPNFGQERAAWQWVKRNLERDDVSLMGQNFMYDMQYFIRHGIYPKHPTDDSMLMHHSRYPELQKDLGFLGSIYTNHPSWKLLNSRHADEFKQGN
ncbi:hypothetical protein Kuura_029 [Caulobacter phage Kuura]|nr:hypothetical protein Kuura_029 [Caulobacter phage Kuura]